MWSTRKDKIQRKLKGQKKKKKKKHENKRFRGIGLKFGLWDITVQRIYRGIGLKFFGRDKRRKHKNIELCAGGHMGFWSYFFFG